MKELALPDRKPGITLTRWLYEELRRAILEGRLKRGAPLPPTRHLAETYALSRRIAVNVFGQLRDEGYLTARTGSGTVVSDSIPEDFLTQAKPSKKTPTTPQLDPVYRRPVRAFRPIEPALDHFPVNVWARITGRVIRNASTAVLAGGDAAGFAGLRQAICDHLGAARGVSCTPDQILITSGTQQSLDLLARATLQPGDPVWMEDPGYSDAAEAFARSGANVIAAPVDQYGINIATLTGKPKAVYVTPAHQFPLGATLPLDRRLDLLRLRTLIFEDDYDSEFRFSGKPVPAMKGLAGADHVFLLGTFNKSMFPALRIGYIVVPDHWLDRVLKRRRQFDRYAAPLPQAALAEFIADGHYAKHLRRMRELYAERLSALQSEVKRQLDGVLRIPEIQAGLNTPAFLQNGMSSRRAQKIAENHNVECWTLDRFSLARQDLRGLVLGFAAFTPRQIRQGVALLARALTVL